MFKIQRIFTFFIGLFVIVNSYANANASELYDLIRENKDRGNYLGALKQLHDNRQKYTSQVESKSFYYSLLADYETFLGLQHRALKHNDKIGQNSPSNQQTRQNTLDILKYRLKSAKERIANVAKNHSVIFINEAHHSTRHRAFTLSLLQELYDQGFRYFAAETFCETDAEVNQRGYPLSLKSGYYTEEPVYGELFREAHRIGYKIIPYEYYSESDCEPFHDAPEHCANLREQGQAKNLYERVFKLDPNAKLLVHAGYGHIAKQSAKNGFTPMAVYFKQYTGIEPFSIDQTIMSEHGYAIYENSIYKQIANLGSLKENSVLVDEINSDWVPSTKEKFYDLIVFQPRTIYKNDRPTWLFEFEPRKHFLISNNICKNNFPCVVEAFREEEGVDSVPIDRFLIQKPGHTYLALKQGAYIIRARSKSGDIVTIQNSIVV